MTQRRRKRRNNEIIQSILKIKKEDDGTPKKRFCRKVKAPKCAQSLKKPIKSLAEPFEGSEFYPMAEPFPPEPFLSSTEQKKGSVGNIQNPGGSGLSSNGFVWNPHSSVLDTLVLVQNHQGSVCFRRNLFLLCGT